MQKSIVLPSTEKTEMKQFIMDATADASRKDLIQVLQSVQEKYGYLPKEGLRLIAINLDFR
jgi:NADH:ubiquinone oxidoreductase subunit E